MLQGSIEEIRSLVASNISHLSAPNISYPDINIPESSIVPNEIKTELERYISLPNIRINDDIFAWWKVNQANFSLLSFKVGKFLSAPPTSVPSEHIFSTAGGVIDDHRTSLLSGNAEELVFLKTNSKNFD